MSDLSEHTDQKAFNKLYQSAIALLARREHSVSELTQKLSRKLDPAVASGDGEALLNQVLTKVIADGYLSDQRYAEAYTRSRMNKGFGFDRIRNELNQKGIAPELIASTLSAFDEPEAEQERIAYAWRKKFKHVPCDFNEKMKQIRFLRYRGFGQSDIDRFFAQLGETFDE